MTTIKDLIRDEIVEYEHATRAGETSDPDALLEAIMDVLHDQIHRIVGV